MLLAQAYEWNLPEVNETKNNYLPFNECIIMLFVNRMYLQACMSCPALSILVAFGC